MADLNALVQQAYNDILARGAQPLEDALYGRQEADIRDQAANRAQQIAENAFGRGLGLSSIAAYLQGQNEKAQADALAKARTDAYLASQQAQLAAVGQAAGVAQQELNRNTQNAQFSANQDMQKRALNQQASIANKNLLAGGLGLGLGAATQVLGKTFAPEITGGLRNLFGLGGSTPSPYASLGLRDLSGFSEPSVSPLPTGGIAAGEPSFSFGMDTSFGSPSTALNLSSGLGSDFGGFSAGGGLDALAGLDLSNLGAIDWSAFTLPDLTQSTMFI